MFNFRGALLHQPFQMIFMAPLVFNQSSMIQSPRHPGLHLTQVHRLGYVIKCTGPHCLDRKIDRLLTADHHNNGVRCALVNSGHQLKARNSGHVDVAQDEVERARL